MRIDQLYTKLKVLDFIENFYISTKKLKGSQEPAQVIKIYAEDKKIAEVYLNQMQMLRTSYIGFAKLDPEQKTVLSQLLFEFSQTPIDERQSELYLVYYKDLDDMMHFIKRSADNHLIDEMRAITEFEEMTYEECQAYLFNVADLEEFPENFRPQFIPDTFIKITPFAELKSKMDAADSENHSDEDH